MATVDERLLQQLQQFNTMYKEDPAKPMPPGYDLPEQLRADYTPRPSEHPELYAEEPTNFDGWKVEDAVAHLQKLYCPPVNQATYPSVMIHPTPKPNIKGKVGPVKFRLRFAPDDKVFALSLAQHMADFARDYTTQRAHGATSGHAIAVAEVMAKIVRHNKTGETE